MVPAESAADKASQLFKMHNAAVEEELQRLINSGVASASITLEHHLWDTTILVDGKPVTKFSMGYLSPL